ncbi:aspartyl protease family protein [Lacinutrix sp. C3R15]|uniref:aspartyl protease family protein n=1 Tax=Flavobacteriaceae TaxID=49546 RepID=UPI001C093449|nr:MULTISPECIES: aspartyl protease family protein [Flavobacteriaceae]MBU2939326.1 aspartyl protease family protein [Lacinutrix sp. C3R15]MDO6622641.1 aspartyl protease family protein [Oceanihabitans sp. 1_MG-2023]
MKRIVFTFILLFGICFYCLSQGTFVIQNKKKTDKIKFKLINNLVVIPVKINGVELSFILDTGVSKPILFNIFNINETLKINNAQKIVIRGLGEGEPVEALRSKKNIIEIGEAVNINQDLFVVYNSKLNFAPKLGIPIHGIIGYDFFKDLVVEINYSSKFIKIFENEIYKQKKCKKCEILPLYFYNKKPYINAEVTIDDKPIPVKLLIDSGGSDSIWLFENTSLGIHANERYFTDFLGHGLSGSVYGKRSKVDAFTIRDFTLHNANVAFPDSTSISFARNHKDRNGSLAGNVLKRFRIVFNYKKSSILLKKSKFFNDDFTYNKSGIELEQNGIRLVREKDNSRRITTLDDANAINNEETRVVYNANYKLSVKPAYTIVELRKNSPAEKAGLQVGDIVLKINGKETYNLTLQKSTQYFYEKEGKIIKLKIDRLGKILDFKFTLESLF